MIRILLLEDHALIREGLKMLIEQQPDMEIVDEASDLFQAVRSECDPEVVVSDLILPDKRGPATVAALHHRFPKAGILVLTVVDSPVQAQLCLSAGARGFLLKEAAVPALIEGIRKVNAGEMVLDPSFAEGPVSAEEIPSGESRKPIAYRLNKVELDLVKILGLGHTNTEAAKMLDVSVRTIESRRAQIMSKLGLRTRAELIQWAFEKGLLP